MLKPLTQFYCDTCGEIINCPKEGWIEWISENDKEKGTFKTHSFRIVHHMTHSPIATKTNNGCYQHSKKIERRDSHLDHFLSKEYKMANILMFLDIGSYHNPEYNGTYLTDMRQYVETVRRLTIPYYEEARHYWTEALDDGFFIDANERMIFSVNNLKHLIEKYGNK
jgi:hypothetical protein